MSSNNERDSKRNPSLNLMARRLGVFYPGPPVHAPQEKANDSVITSLEGIYHQSQLLNNMGGHAQQERMIYDKKRTLDRALKYSYQGADIKNVNAEDDELPCRALINPNKLKQDYDDKVVSCNWDHGLAPGSVFKWMGTNTYWLVYLQDLTELAYFRGDIRKCSYIIKWVDEDKKIHSTYAAVRGPVETKINTVVKSGTSYDLPNYSLNMLIPKTPDTEKVFKRYFKFYIQDIQEGAKPTCWRIEAIDSISTPGIINFNALEYYSNKDTDDIGEIADYIPEEADEENVSLLMANKVIAESKTDVIQGDGFIKPKVTYTYSCAEGGEWSVKGSSKPPILVLSKTENEIKIKWDKFYSGQFVLCCGDAEKTIVVETLY